MFLQDLFEGREEFVAQQLGPRIEAAVKNDNGRKPAIKTPLDVVKHIATAGPKNVQWLVKMYVDGQYKLEDITQLKQDIAKFNKVRTSLPQNQRDLNAYRSLNQLYDVIEQSADAPPQKFKGADRLQSADLEEYFKAGDLEWFYKDQYIQVVIPNTEDASCQIGSGTKWCTAAKKAENYFEEYTAQGPVYTIFTHDGKRFQLHIAEEYDLAEVDPEDVDQEGLDVGAIEFMDVRNQPVDLAKFGQTYPSVKKAFADQIKLWPKLLAWGTPEIALQQVKRKPANIAHVPYALQTEELANEILHGDEWSQQFALYLNPKFLTDDQIRKAARGQHPKTRHMLGQVPDEFWNERTLPIVVGAKSDNVYGVPAKVQKRLSKVWEKALRSAIQKRPNMLIHFNSKFQTAELVDKAMDDYPRMFSYIRPDLMKPEYMEQYEDWIKEREQQGHDMSHDYKMIEKAKRGE